MGFFPLSDIVWQGVAEVNSALSITIAFLSIARGFCHSSSLLHWISFFLYPRKGVVGVTSLKLLLFHSLFCIWPSWPFLFVLYKKGIFILFGKKVTPDHGWWLWFTWTLLFAVEVWGLARDAVSLLLAADACACLPGCGSCGFWGENPAFFQLMTLAVLGPHLGVPLSKAFRKPKKLASRSLSWGTRPIPTEKRIFAFAGGSLRAVR